MNTFIPSYKSLENSRQKFDQWIAEQKLNESSPLWAYIKNRTEPAVLTRDQLKSASIEWWLNAFSNGLISISLLDAHRIIDWASTGSLSNADEIACEMRMEGLWKTAYVYEKLPGYEALIPPEIEVIHDNWGFRLYEPKTDDCWRLSDVWQCNASYAEFFDGILEDVRVIA